MRRCLEALNREVPITVRLQEPRRGGPEAEAFLELELAGAEVPYAVEVMRAIRKHHLGALVHLATAWQDAGRRLLVCTDRMPAELGEALRAKDVAYIDLGGNAFLRDPRFHVLVAGRPAPEAPRGRTDIRKTDTRLLGLFLRDRDACTAIQTDLAARAGIALGAVGPARERLAELGILGQGGDRTWFVRDREAGLRRFADGWAAVLRHKLAPRTYRLLLENERGPLEARLRAEGEPLGCLLGGERAAAHLTQFLETDYATLHVRPGEREAVAKALTLVPDAEGTVTLLERFGLGDEYHHDALPGVALVHPLLVWAECLTIPDDRVTRTARLLREEFLDHPHE